ncbi:hypothetical protein [Winogradskyella sediminis]|uniref:Dihydroorotase n=1 Tax=Winogradskyella sediminis TaxID=1382466 RepID=A0A1H1VY78_9FLAO|nr:hypothetical protein [Winogradskyella sediminis]REG87854.1 hypothetical protein C8N41_102700 [Winogradskyella sediminis]SDS89206.1 hypothetical protein SAMN04489797_2684 [Winogradskyella sediminis]
MKKLLFTLLCFTFFLTASANNEPKVGDVLTVKIPADQNFNHIEFPRANILIKRGVVTGYKSVNNETVVIDNIETKKNGSTVVTLKKKDGSKFFGILKNVKADYTKAIASGELLVVK